MRLTSSVWQGKSAGATLGVVTGSTLGSGSANRGVGRLVVGGGLVSLEIEFWKMVESWWRLASNSSVMAKGGVWECEGLQ